MLIENVSIVHFGKLHGLKLDFCEGFNLIEGKNESGKSTIAGFIRYMLYGFSSISDKRRYVSWESSSAEGAMTVLSSDGKRYRIDRKTLLVSSSSGKDQYKESASITDLSTNTPVFGKEKAGEAILKMPEEIFDKVAFISQMTDSTVDGEAISDAIENMLFWGDEKISAQKALDKIDSARRTLLHKNEKGGELYELSERIAELKRRFNEAIEENSAVLELESSLNKTEHEIKKTEKEIEKLNLALEIYSKMQLLAKFSLLHRAEEEKKEADNKRKALTEENTKDGFLPDNAYLSDLTAIKRSVDDAKESVIRREAKCQALRSGVPLSSECEDALSILEGEGGISSVENRIKGYRKKAKSLLSTFIFSLIICVSAFAVYFLDVYPSPIVLGLGGGLLFVGVFLLISFASQKKKEKEDYKKLALGSYDEFCALISKLSGAVEAQKGNEQALALAKSDLDEAKATYKSRINEFKTAISRAGITYEDGVDLKEYIDKLNDTLSRFYSEDRALHTESVRLQTSIDQLSALLANENESELNEFLTPDKKELVRNIEPNTLQRNLSFLYDKQKALVSKEKELRARYISSKARLESPSQIKERIDEWENKYASLKKQYDAYVLASEAISGAGDRLRNQLSPTLSKIAKESISKVTNGKYEEIGIDSSLSLSYTYENAVRQPDSLSGGAKAVFYICLRLALLETLSKERAPLCLDESLVYQDRERAKEILSLLLDESKERLQCFLFSCHERESELLEGHDVKIIRI